MRSMRCTAYVSLISIETANTVFAKDNLAHNAASSYVKPSIGTSISLKTSGVNKQADIETPIDSAFSGKLKVFIQCILYRIE